MGWMTEEIMARGGAVPFDVFMDLALYHPEYGYYSGDQPRYGRAGDFLTAPTASEWYSRVVARFAGNLAACTGSLRLVDIASGDGSFVSGVIDALGSRAADVFGGVISVERSSSMRRLQDLRFRGGEISVTTAGGIEPIDLESTANLVHASEFYDALPVARVVCEGGKIRETWVAVCEDGLTWSARPARDEVSLYFERHGVDLADRQIAEANLGAFEAHRTLLNAVGLNGLVVVLDYGYEAHRLYDARGRGAGSLSTFSNHQLGRDPLVSPGEIDLTAHVNWGDLRTAASSEGWVELGLWPLAEFLVRAGIADELDDRGLGMEAEVDAATVTARQEIKRLLDPEGMGSDLTVLVQAKGDLVSAAQSVLNAEF